MEANKEIRNDELKVAMITLKLEDNEANENDFIEKLRQGYFIIPAVKDGKNDEFTFMLLCDQNANNYFQAYTDLEEFNKWHDAKKAEHFVLKFDELAHIIINSDEEVKGLALNPFSENFILNKEYLNKVFTMGKIFISEKNTCSTKTKNVMKKVLKENKQVNKAYLFDIKKNNIQGYLLIIDSSSKDKDKLHEEIGTKIVDNIKEINIDIISSKDEIAKEVTKDKKEFYKKEVKKD